MVDKILFVVTGASGGFGSGILRQLNAMYADSACIIACSRNSAKIAEISKDFKGTVKTISVDFSKREGIKENCQNIFELYKGCAFSEVYLFNNHASMNDCTTSLSSLDDPTEIDDYMFLNVTSFQILTSVFLHNFPGIQHTAVNISSMASLVAIPSFGLYCSGKSARMMLYQVLAAEEPDVNVFNYSPGPLATDMTKNLSKDVKNEGTRKMFSDHQTKQSWVDIDESAVRMLNILKNKDYKSGEQIDFYDRK